MNTNPAPDMVARRLVLAAGASAQLVLRDGAAVVCMAGSVRVDEPAANAEAAEGLPRGVAVRLNAGEAHGLSYGGVARITAIGAAELICMDRPGLTSRFFYRAMTYFRLLMPGNRKNPVGALHKISK